MGTRKIKVMCEDEPAKISVRHELGLNDLVDILNELDKKTFKGIIWCVIRERKQHKKLEKAISKRLKFTKKFAIANTKITEDYYL